MKGTVLYGPRDVRFEERPEPRIEKRTDAIIRISATCVCGSDLWPYRGVQSIAKPTPMGHEHALELGWPCGDTPTVVVTGRKLHSTRKSVEFYSGDLKMLVHEKLASRFRNIWLVGGAMLAQRFLSLGLVNEICLAIAPVLLGDGLRLFGSSLAEKRWSLNNVVAYRNGFVELTYEASSH